MRNEEIEEKKRRNYNESLFACISEMAGAHFVKFGMWTPLTGPHLSSKFDSNRIRDYRAT